MVAAIPFHNPTVAIAKGPKKRPPFEVADGNANNPVPTHSRANVIAAFNVDIFEDIRISAILRRLLQNSGGDLKFNINIKSPYQQ